MATASSQKRDGAIRKALLAHYHRHKRDLPWRRTKDPYRIWVSEVMCQQTQVDTVVPRYQEFLRRYPSVEQLAAATQSQACEAWAGLGYYRRARLMHQAAEVVVREHGGRFPDQAKALQRLPGIGRYTAGAIASICFDERAPLVDGNVARVFARLDAIPGPSADPQVQKILWRRAEELVQGPEPGDFNQAIMELGATLCTPRRPQCDVCPVRAHCRAYAEGAPTRYPGEALRAPKKELPVVFAWVRTKRGVWLHQRPLEGLWPGLWEPPSAAGPDARERLGEELGVPLTTPVATLEHVLSHRVVRATVYLPATTPRLRQSGTCKVVTNPLAAPLSALARKVVLQLL